MRQQMPKRQTRFPADAELLQVGADRIVYFDLPLLPRLGDGNRGDALRQ